MNALFPDVFALNTADKLKLISELWDSLSSDPESIPVPDWQKQELDHRKAGAQADPQFGISWNEAKRRIRDRHAI